MMNALIIFCLQILYVPIMTLRITFVVKGKKREASLAALLEGVVYIISLGIVFSDLSNIANIVAYVLGYAIGIYVGCMVEEKLAIGYRTIHVSVTHACDELITGLREKGFGVTVFKGEGRENAARWRLEIISHRKREPELLAHIGEYEPNAFVVAYEPTAFRGGYLTKQMRSVMGKVS
ncbi:MAG: DUF2179 domain-containing protein [Bacilli bacterium]